MNTLFAKSVLLTTLLTSMLALGACSTAPHSAEGKSDLRH